MKLVIYGFPGLFGGAATELHHQICVLAPLTKSKGIELWIIPTQEGYKNEPLYQWCLDQGVQITTPHNFSILTESDAIISFCSSDFLKRLPTIHKITKNTCFVNCMTWLFDQEQVAHRQNLIKLSLYQREGVRVEHQFKLQKIGSKGIFKTFVPYFDESSTEFSLYEGERVCLGRISRPDSDKFGKHINQIYDWIVSPKLKRGIFLGWKEETIQKIGVPPVWIERYSSHREFPVKDFYKTVNFVCQPTSTNENWPRIGFEAMHSGCPLIVDNRGGWRSMIVHGKTGFLCDNERDFIYWGSRLCYEVSFREDIAHQAKEHVKTLSGFDVSHQSWEEVLDLLFN